MIIDVVIPAINEERAIGKVISSIPKDMVRNIIVADNGSTDTTVREAQKHGAVVIDARPRGYGNACLKGIEFSAHQTPKPDVIVFLDGDYSDYPEEMEQLIQPIRNGQAEMVIGSRVRGEREVGSLTPQQRFGNALATTLIKWLLNASYTDLGPFRAITFDALERLGMKDRNYGWTVEMQIKAAKLGVKSIEVPVSYRNRIGQSKVSGTLKGSIFAGYKILATIARYA